MSILDTVSNLIKRTIDVNLFQSVGKEYAPPRDLKGFLEANKGWVYSATSAIADDFSDIDLRLYMMAKRGHIDVTEQELKPMNVLENPNRLMTKRDLFWLHSQYLELSGQCFWYTPLDSSNEPAMIIPLLPYRVKAVRSDSDQIIAGYIYTNAKGQRIPLDFEEVKYFRKPDPMDPLVGGLGTASAAAVAIDTFHYASQWNKNFFYNSAIPEAVLKTKKSLTEEQFYRLKDEFNQQHRGTAQAHKIGLLEAGLEYQKIATDPKDMDFRGLKQETRDEILGAFRVPKSVVGITDDVNRANAEATDYVFSKRVIKPRMARFVDSLNKVWLPSFKTRASYKYGYIDPTPSDKKMEYETREIGIRSGQLLINEAREEMDKPKVQGGDDAYLPVNLAPIGQKIADDGKEDDDKGKILVYAEKNKPKKQTPADK